MVVGRYVVGRLGNGVRRSGVNSYNANLMIVLSNRGFFGLAPSDCRLRFQGWLRGLLGLL